MKIESKEIGKLVGLAKRVYTTAKTRTIKVVVDQIEDYENEYFKDDTKLAGMVKEKQILEKELKERKKFLDTQIENHISTILKTKRGYDATAVYEDRWIQLTGLLQDSLNIIETIGDPNTKPDSEYLAELKTRLMNTITQLGEEGGL